MPGSQQSETRGSSQQVDVDLVRAENASLRARLEELEKTIRRQNSQQNNNSGSERAQRATAFTIPKPTPEDRLLARGAIPGNCPRCCQPGRMSDRKSERTIEYPRPAQVRPTVVSRQTQSAAYSTPQTVSQGNMNENQQIITASCAIAGCTPQELPKVLRQWMIDRIRAEQQSAQTLRVVEHTVSSGSEPILKTEGGITYDSSRMTAAQAQAVVSGREVDFGDKSSPAFNCSDSEVVDYFMRAFEISRRATVIPAISAISTRLEAERNALRVIRDLLGLEPEASVGLVVDAVEALVVSGRFKAGMEELESIPF